MQYFYRLLSADHLGEAIGQEAWKTAVNGIGQQICSTIFKSLQNEGSYADLGISGEIHLDYSEFFYSDDTTTDWIGVIAYIPLNWPDPFGFFTDKNIVAGYRLRAFTGLEQDNIAEAGDNQNPDSEAQTYYRIGNGTHYHSLSCYLIQKSVQMSSETSAIEQGYKACSRCGGGKGTVWTTPGGECYHIKGCSSLFPDVAPLSADEFESGVYSPCAICQSEGGWFH